MKFQVKKTFPWTIGKVSGVHEAVVVLEEVAPDMPFMRTFVTVQVLSETGKPEEGAFDVSKSVHRVVAVAAGAEIVMRNWVLIEEKCNA